MHSRTYKAALLLLVLAFTLSAFAQESAVKGNLAGVVTDASGAVVPGAKVTVTGPTGSTSVETNSAGAFTLPLLTPGYYGLKVEKEGFKAADVKNVEVVTNKTASVRIGLEPGAVTETVEVSAATVTVDTSATAVSSNLTDTFYSAVPVGRSVTSLFYASPGVVGGAGTGAANPSIGGGSGLENQYVADGVNITDGSFGGIGVYSRVYGSLSTGINLSFIKEVQVKTAAFEPQYGKSTGGVVQIVTKSGGSEFHGAIGGFFAPQSWEKDRLHADDAGRFNQFGKRLHEAHFDVNGELGGYVPGFRENVFFFGSFNPAWNRYYDQFAEFRSPHLAQPIGGHFDGLENLGETRLDGVVYAYAAKGTIRLNDMHQVETSIFGDPTRDDAGPWASLATSSHNGDDERSYGTRNIVARYNGTWTPTWLFNTSWSWGHNYLEDTPVAPDVPFITDLTQRSFPDTLQRGQYNVQGFGYYENTEGDNYAWTTDTQKTWNFLGTQTTSIGYQFSRNYYGGSLGRTGGRFEIPSVNFAGDSAEDVYGSTATADLSVGQLTDGQYQLRTDPTGGCTECPLLDVPNASGGYTPRHVFLFMTRGQFSGHEFKTSNNYHTVYGNNSWAINKYITFNAGLRWEQQQMNGADTSYTFTGNWSPRLGIIVDPFGDRKTKISANFARMSYQIPLDMAIRALTNAQSLINLSWIPDDADHDGYADINPDGTIATVFDADHLISDVDFLDPDDVDEDMDTTEPDLVGDNGGIANTFFAPFGSGLSLTAIAPGTKMMFQDEWTLGFERELPGNVIFSARYVDRRLKRIVEDSSALSPEAGQAGLQQVYIIGNVGATVDNFTNYTPHQYTPGDDLPAACDPQLNNPGVTDAQGNVVGAVCWETNADAGLPIPDGIPDGFPNPTREYQAMEFEFNKSFSKNWQMRANWRIARLQGNFEGAFRNDNGQSDPAISSLFDFTAGDFGLLGDQFATGPLNTDRRHVVNGFFSYVFDRGIKGLTLGTSMRFETGVPLNQFLAHPVYTNAGEVPTGGRGALGRTEENYTVDLKVDYPFQISERQRLRVGVDLFNITNQKKLLRVDQNLFRTIGVPNLDYGRPNGSGIAAAGAAYQRPFYARASVRWEF